MSVEWSGVEWSVCVSLCVHVFVCMCVVFVCICVVCVYVYDFVCMSVSMYEFLYV